MAEMEGFGAAIGRPQAAKAAYQASRWRSRNTLRVILATQTPLLEAKMAISQSTLKKASQQGLEGARPPPKNHIKLNPAAPLKPPIWTPQNEVNGRLGPPWAASC